jgi:alpha-D-ribose 1-methylphosphonate 5-triphosphate synthase subunit PhnL
MLWSICRGAPQLQHLTASFDSFAMAQKGPEPVWSTFIASIDLVLADEPTGSLGAPNADSVLEMLRELNAVGTTMIVVTHDDRVAAQCNRVMALPDPDSAIEP